MNFLSTVDPQLLGWDDHIQKKFPDNWNYNNRGIPLKEIAISLNEFDFLNYWEFLKITGFLLVLIVSQLCIMWQKFEQKIVYVKIPKRPTIEHLGTRDTSIL